MRFLALMVGVAMLGLMYGCSGCLDPNSHLSDCPNWLPGGWHNR